MKMYFLLFLQISIFFFNTVNAADRYVVSAGGNYNSASTWASTSGGNDAVAVPTAADNVYLDANSGPLTINAASVCQGSPTNFQAIASVPGGGSISNYFWDHDGSSDYFSWV